VKNVGSRSVANFHVDYFLSKDTQLDANDLAFGGHYTSNKYVAVGATYEYRGLASVNTAKLTDYYSGSNYLIGVLKLDQDGVLNNNTLVRIFELPSTKSLSLQIDAKVNVSLENKGSFLKVENLSENELGGSIIVSGLNNTTYREYKIDNIGDMHISTEWNKGSKYVFVRIIDKNGDSQSFKLSN